MLNSRTFFNSRPDGFGVLEITNTPARRKAHRHFVPLRLTHLTGDISGPLASLRLIQTFALDADETGRVIEAAYRFPLPGDAAVTGMRVRFGDTEICTTLKERTTAEAEYSQAKRSGKQAALVTRESPDVFTLMVTGIHAGQAVVIQTEYIQLARPEGQGWSLRIPLTTAPRYVREDEAGSRHAAGQPLAILRDPGHRFALDVTLRGAEHITSPTHQITTTREETTDRVRLHEGEVIPDRDCVINWQPATVANRPNLAVWTDTDASNGHAYFLALCSPPATKAAVPLLREVVLLVDHSGSMSGAKWEAADWAVERFLAGLSDCDSFALGLFHNTTRWLAREPQRATAEAVQSAVAFLREHRDQGGTELGVALEQSLDLPRSQRAASRHVLIITDAEVTDAGRLLRLVEQEEEQRDRRRVSVLCIDAAPNAGLADELASRGGGTARYLTSDPAEDDITTALDEVLADWAAPVAVGLTLEVNRPAAEASGRSVAMVVPGPAAGIDIGDLPTGRPVWVVGRVPLGAGSLAFKLRSRIADAVLESSDEAGGSMSGVKALFGADRIRRLEYVRHAGLAGDALVGELARLGVAVSDRKVYAENATIAGSKALRDVLVRESLRFGLPCSETAFVAIRTEAGKVATETVVVANALPAGWDSNVVAGSASLRCASRIGGAGGVLMRKRCALPNPGGSSGSPMKLTPEMIERLRTASVRGQKLSLTDMTKPVADGTPQKVRIVVAKGQHPTGDGAVLFDSTEDAGTTAIPEPCRFTAIAVKLSKHSVIAALDPDLTILVFVGDATTPRARVRLVDVLRQGGHRPLNLDRKLGEVVRLVLADPVGCWRGGIPDLEITLKWTR